MASRWSKMSKISFQPYRVMQKHSTGTCYDPTPHVEWDILPVLKSETEIPTI